MSAVATYPPTPWRLRGWMYLSLWGVPPEHLPDLPVTRAGPVRPIRVAGRAVVAVAWARYAPGGVLAYRELLTAVAARIGRRPAVTLAGIWVDDPHSRAGARAQWGIPKELARVRVDAPVAAAPRCAAARGVPLAAARLRLGRPLPGRWPFRVTVAQAYPVADAPVGPSAPADASPSARLTAARGSARVRLCAVDWDVQPDGPLGFLAGRRPWWSVCLTDLRLTIG